MEGLLVAALLALVAYALSKALPDGELLVEHTFSPPTVGRIFYSCRGVKYRVTDVEMYPPGYDGRTVYAVYGVEVKE